MPTVILVDCSLGMAERFPFMIKQDDKTESRMNIEKRSLVAKFIESLTNNTQKTVTKLEAIALVFFAGANTIKIAQHFTRNTEALTKSVQKLPIFGDYALKPAIEFAKKYLTTVYGSHRSQKILVFTDSSHRDDDSCSPVNDRSNAMDVDLRDSKSDDSEETSSILNAHTDVSFVCVRKPSGTERARFEDVTKHSQCSLSKIYWLINREKQQSVLITNQMVQDLIDRVKTDMMHVLISTLKCGHYESQLAVYPAIKPAILQTTGEILQPSNTLTVNGFIELSSISSAMAVSKHILLPIYRHSRSQTFTPMFATKKSAAANSSTASTTSTTTSMQKKLNSANYFYYLLLIGLKKEKTAALISVNDQWYGAIHCQKCERKKKSTPLILSVFEPGDCIPWIPSFERLGPYALVFPQGNNLELVYKKQTWPVKPFARSYTETFLIWCRQNNFQSDINKLVRNSGKLPEKTINFNRELNKICHGAFVYGLRERLFHLLQKLFERQVELGKIKPDGVKYIQNVISYMNRLSTSDRYIKYGEN